MPAAILHSTFFILHRIKGAAPRPRPSFLILNSELISRGGNGRNDHHSDNGRRGIEQGYHCGGHVSTAYCLENRNR